MISHLYLSRRNLLVLLSKLDRVKRGETSACTIIKFDTKNPNYRQAPSQIHVTAVEDENYYTDRPPGDMHPADELSLTQPIQLCSTPTNLEAIVNEVIAGDPLTVKQAQEFAVAEGIAFNSLVGRVMKALRGKCNPALVVDVLKKKLAGQP